MSDSGPLRVGERELDVKNALDDVLEAGGAAMGLGRALGGLFAACEAICRAGVNGREIDWKDAYQLFAEYHKYGFKDLSRLYTKLHSLEAALDAAPIADANEDADDHEPAH
jgi:hypothetical protein